MTEKQIQTEAGWKFDNSYARLPDIFYTKMSPVKVKAPKSVIVNERLVAELGLEIGALEGDEGAAVFAGNVVPDGAEPLAQAYAGHQFGHFTMLGDGRAILLGEHLTPEGNRLDIQLKGSGITPYSRRGDGRAALGPMLREYLISEAMHGLGVPTTRSLAVVTTGESIYRETELPGAVLTRVAASHIRVGTFEYAASMGSVEDLRTLADYTIDRHYASLRSESDEDIYLRFLGAVIDRQAALVARWQTIGFVHGVMNTDNMAISGETIDYGPCAFMDVYHPETVFSSIDTYGRYAYGNQPKIAAWNLARFAETLLPLLHDDQEQAVKRAQGAIAQFPERFRFFWLQGMTRKLGIPDCVPDDVVLVEDLLRLMEKFRADFTETFYALTTGELQGEYLFETTEFREWHTRWKQRLAGQSADACREQMQTANPRFIPRNHLVEEALQMAVENADLSTFRTLLDIVANPYRYTSQVDARYIQPSRSTRPYRTFCGT